MAYTKRTGVCDPWAYSYVGYFTTKMGKTKTIIAARLDLKSIGRRIRQVRGFELSQAEFGRILQIGQTQLSKYELGQSAPTLQVLLKLKAYSGKSIDWIVTGEDVGQGN